MRKYRLEIDRDGEREIHESLTRSTATALIQPAMAALERGACVALVITHTHIAAPGEA